MKKKVLSVILACAMAISLIACGGEDTTSVSSANTGASETVDEPAAEPAADAEIVDGKFTETRHITVEVYDRGTDGGKSDAANNYYTNWIKEQMLALHNVEVEFVAVPRWTETDEINNLLAANNAPDICVTYSYPTIQTYADMGGVLDLQNYVEDYKDMIPNLWGWLGETNMYWDKNDEDGTLWAIEGKLANSRRILTFMRKDWLDALGIAEPTNQAEFYAAICAFRDNADTLLGADADKMVPFSVSYDVGWRAALLIESQIDPAITDKEFYINGFDDRKYTEEGTKEAVRILNKWYHEGLLWDDFALYGSGDSTEDDMMKAGYVGAFQHNWDYPFRNADDSIQANLQRIVGENAKYVAVDCFENANGETLKYVSSTAGDRKIFFPATNDEPLASLLYLDFISTPEVLQYLQIGDEGVTHIKHDDGSYEIIPAEGDKIQNSGQNIDMTITCNGLQLVDPELTIKSSVYNYAKIDPADVEKAIKLAETNMKKAINVKVPPIEAETGMGEALNAKRDIAFDNSIVCAVEDFDATWDAYMDDYLSTGGAAIKAEREEKWNAVYGDAQNIR